MSERAAQPTAHHTPESSVKHPSQAAGPIEAIWLAAAFKRWHVPVLAGTDSALPYITLEGDDPVALFFTTRRRARRAIDGWIGEVADLPVQSRQISREAACNVLSRLHGRGMQWIRIDHGPRSIRLPLESLVGAMQRVWEQDLRCGREAGVWTWLALQERVLMLRDPAADGLPLVEIVDEAPSIRLFVDMPRAMARAARLSLCLDGDRQQRVISMDGSSSVECLRRLAHLGVEQIVLEQPGGQRSVPLAALLQEARRAA
ncbi:MAG: hypothetical protein QF733_03945 [Phycisphaerales bacterium]|jgi:hypothetical protein|nr:hypothetical protein [Phycisphaerales bacterium]